MANKRITKDTTPACTAKQAVELCAEYLEKDAERLELDRESRVLDSRQKAIAKELRRFVLAGGKCYRQVPRFRLELVEADGFFSYLNNLIGEIGTEEFERRKAAVPKVAKLEITELRPASRRSTTTSTRSTTRTKTTPGVSKKRAA